MPPHLLLLPWNQLVQVTSRRRPLLGVLLGLGMLGFLWETGRTQELSIRVSEATRTLGIEIGEASGQEFGSIAGVRSLSGGRVVVLDGKRGHVALFSIRGDPLGGLGRLGGGPGEFLDPRVAGILKDRLLILDVAALKVNILRLAGDTVQYDRSFAVDGFVADACVLGDHVFVLSYAERGILHKYTLDGVRVRDFGNALGVDAPITRGGTIRGRVLCAEESGTILVLSRQPGLIAAFEATTGEQLWETTPATFTPSEVSLYDQGRGMRTRIPEGGYFDTIISGILLTPRLMAAQVRRIRYRTRSNPKDGLEQTLRTMVLDVATGETVGQPQEGIPLLLEVSNGHVWALEESDVPRIGFRRLTISP